MTLSEKTTHKKRWKIVSDPMIGSLGVVVFFFGMLCERYANLPQSTLAVRLRALNQMGDLIFSSLSLTWEEPKSLLLPRHRVKSKIKGIVAETV